MCSLLLLAGVQDDISNLRSSNARSSTRRISVSVLMACAQRAALFYCSWLMLWLLRGSATNTATTADHGHIHMYLMDSHVLDGFQKVR
jgi:hypothetical protein